MAANSMEMSAAASEDRTEVSGARIADGNSGETNAGPFPGAAQVDDGPVTSSASGANEQVDASTGQPDASGWDPSQHTQGAEVEDASVDVVLEAVSQRAAEIGKNVAELASTASNEAAAVVHGISETVSGFSTGFVSLFSVFDPSAEEAVAAVAQAQGNSEETASATGNESRNRGAAALSSQAGDAPRRRVASHSIDLQANFGLAPEESLLEAFPCRLLQTYRCWHNSFTPDIRKAFSGTLYLTERHVCFLVDENGRRIPIRLQVEQLGSVSREPVKRGAAASSSDHLRLNLRLPEQERDLATASPAAPWLLLSNFEGEGDLESALALLEHLTSHD